MPTGTTVSGWAILLTLAGTFYWATNQRKNKNRRLTDAKQPRGQESKSEKTRKRKDTGQSSGDQSIKPAQKSPAKQQKKKTEVKHVDELKIIATGRALDDSDGDDKVDDKAFAQAMSNAKSGKVGVSQTQATAKPKSVKQKRAHEKPEIQSELIKAPSSTGGDADDDQSLINSPEFGATSLAEPVGGGGVADMLEKPAGGPSVLKINAPTNPAPVKKPKPKTEFESVETKKQRQNRKKAEEKKAARDAEEAERRILLERQRRTAREAEGRAAKDGTSFMASQAPSKSAWTAPPELNGTGDNTATKPIELLDTYEPTNGKVSTKPAEVVHSQSQEHGSEYANLTEDQQLRKAKEESVAWEVVKTKKGKNKATTKGGSGSEDHEYGVPQPAPEKTEPGKTWVMNTTHVDEDLNVVEREVELQDSEWEVA